MVDGVYVGCPHCGKMGGEPGECDCYGGSGTGGGGYYGGGGSGSRDKDDEKIRKQRELEEQKRKERERKEQERQQLLRHTVRGGSLMTSMIRSLFSYRRKEKPKTHSSSNISTNIRNNSAKSRKEQIEQYEKKYLAQIEQQKKELIKLPDNGIGYRVKKGEQAVWADQRTIAFIQNVGKKWNDVHPEKQLVITEISKEGGGELSIYSSDGKLVKKHIEHQRGLDVDIRVFRNDTLDVGVTWRDKEHYDRKLTREFLDLLHADNEVKQIYFNDDVLLKENHPTLPQKRYPKMVKIVEHDNHIHISLD